MNKTLLLSALFLMTIFGTVKILQWITTDTAADSSFTTEQSPPLRSTSNQPLGILNPGGTLDHAKSAACRANLTNLNHYIVQFRTQNPGKPVTLENLKKAGMDLPECPNMGQYIFKNGTFICTIHSATQK